MRYCRHCIEKRSLDVNLHITRFLLFRLNYCLQSNSALLFTSLTSQDLIFIHFYSLLYLYALYSLLYHQRILFSCTFIHFYTIKESYFSALLFNSLPSKNVIFINFYSLLYHQRMLFSFTFIHFYTIKESSLLYHQSTLFSSPFIHFFTIKTPYFQALLFTSLPSKHLIFKHFYSLLYHQSTLFSSTFIHFYTIEDSFAVKKLIIKIRNIDKFCLQCTVYRIPLYSVQFTEYRYSLQNTVVQCTV